MQRLRFLIKPAVLVMALLMVAGCAEEPATATTSNTVPVAGGQATETVALREVTLSVPGMDCPMCPVTVKRALERVAGVSEASADLQRKEAVVKFDPARTDINALIRAVDNAGFSSTLREDNHD